MNATGIDIKELPEAVAGPKRSFGGGGGRAGDRLEKLTERLGDLFQGMRMFVGTFRDKI